MICLICHTEESMIVSTTCYPCLVKWKRAQNEMFALLTQRYGTLGGIYYSVFLNHMRLLVNLYHNDKVNYEIEMDLLRNAR